MKHLIYLVCLTMAIATISCKNQDYKPTADVDDSAMDAEDETLIDTTSIEEEDYIDHLELAMESLDKKDMKAAINHLGKVADLIKSSDVQSDESTQAMDAIKSIASLTKQIASGQITSGDALDTEIRKIAFFKDADEDEIEEE